jgi:SAM-dependent methyltransferase
VGKSDGKPNGDGYQPMYEGFYRRAGQNLAGIPWAAMAPDPSLVGWLDGRKRPAAGARALVVGCGLGDDAEYVARRGFLTTAFDFSPTAIERCRERFPSSAVDFQVADLFRLPTAWASAFDLVVEVRTLQSIPVDLRAAAVIAIGAKLAPGGLLFVHSFGAPDGERFDGPPWPVTATELALLAEAGVERVQYTEEPVSRRACSFSAVYRRT